MDKASLTIWYEVLCTLVCDRGYTYLYLRISQLTTLLELTYSYYTSEGLTDVRASGVQVQLVSEFIF